MTPSFTVGVDSSREVRARLRHGSCDHCHPIDEMRHMMIFLRLVGLSEKDVDLMIEVTPAKLLERTRHQAMARIYLNFTSIG